MNEPNTRDLPLVELELPQGESAEGYLEGYLGTQRTDISDMPADEDVDATVFVKLK